MKKVLTFVFAALVSVVSFGEVITCAQADAIARKLADGESTDVEYTVEGYATYVISPTASKLSFWMADEANAPQGIFEAYSCTGQTGVVKGDKVQVTGKIQHFNDGKTNTGEIFGGTVIVVTPAPVDENYVEFSAVEFEGKGADSPGAEIVIEKNGVTLAVNLGKGTDRHLRVFKNSEMSITSSKRIVKLEFEFDAYDTNPYDGGLDKEVCVEGTAWNFTASQSQARFKRIAVTLGDGECSVAPVETITVAEALEIGNALEDGGKTTETYVVEAFVVKAYDFDEEYKNQSFYMSDDATAERGDFFAKYTTGDVVVEGDKVQVKGKIEKYVKDDKTTIQIYKGVATIATAGLNNVKAASKAVKTIENGQFVIEANGVRYNVLGTAL